MAALTAAQTAAELQRKKDLGIQPTSAANQAAYNNLTATVPAPPMATAASTAAAAPKTTTNAVPAPPSTPTAPSITNNTVANKVPSPPMTSSPTPTVTNYSAVPAPRYNEAPVTNYGGSGSALNEILYSKKQYDEGKAGGNSGQQGWASNNAQQYYSQLDTREAEQVKGMNTQELIDYINSKNSPKGEVPAPQMSFTQNSGYVPPVDLGGYILSPEQIKEEAEKRAAALIQQRTTAANQAKQGMQTSYNRMYTDINQDRGVEDVSNARNLSPFSGRSDYAQGMIAQERARTDRQNQEDLQSRLANIDVSLQDFVNATDDQRQAMINELTRQEREYGLSLDAQKYSQYDANRNYDLNYANVYGQAPGYSGATTRSASTGAASANTNGYSGYTANTAAPRTLAAQNQDFNQQMSVANLMGTYNGQSTLAGKAANLNAAQVYMDATGKIMTPQTDWSGYVRQANASGAKPTYQAQQDTIKNGQTQQQINDKLAGTALDYQKYQYPNTTNPISYSGLTPNQVYDAIKSQYTSPTYGPDGKSTGTKLPTDKTQRQNMIQQILETTRGMPDTTVDQIAASLGITSSEWKEITGHGLGEH